MADEVVAAPEAPAVEAPAAPSAKPKAGSAELARWHGNRAQAQVIKETAEAAAGVEPTDPAGTPPKDPVTGRFLKGAKKTKTAAAATVDPTQPNAAAPVAAKPKADDSKIPDSLAAVRRLVAEGKMEEAFTRAFGKVPEELLNSKAWDSWRHENKKIKAQVAQEREAVQRQANQLQQIHQELSREFAPLHAGREAFKAGDYDEAFRQWTGEDLNAFQRKALRQMTNPGVGKDPAVLELRSENQRLQKQLQDFIQGQTEQQKRAEVERRANDYRASMVASLESSDDPDISSAAKNPKFQQRVWDVLSAHYDRASDSTLPFAEAAELAKDQILAEQQELGGVFGGHASQPVHSGKSVTAPARAATPARPTARAVTTLSQNGAAEAAAQPKLKGKELLDEYKRRAAALYAQQNGIG